MFKLRYYGNTLKFLSYILIYNKNNSRSNGLEINKEELMIVKHISEQESDWIITTFSSFYKLFKLLFKIPESKSPENKGSVEKSDQISVNKKSVEFLGDYMNLFKNKPVELNRFKNEFSHLYDLSKKTPELLTVDNSKIQISQNGLQGRACS